MTVDVAVTSVGTQKPPRHFHDWVMISWNRSRGSRTSRHTPSMNWWRDTSGSRSDWPRPWKSPSISAPCPQTMARAGGRSRPAPDAVSAGLRSPVARWRPDCWDARWSAPPPRSRPRPRVCRKGRRGLNAKRSTPGFSFTTRSHCSPTQGSGGQGRALSGAMAVSMALAAAICLGLVTSKRSRVATIKTPPPATVWLSTPRGGRIWDAKRGET